MELIAWRRRYQIFQKSQNSVSEELPRCILSLGRRVTMTTSSSLCNFLILLTISHWKFITRCFTLSRSGIIYSQFQKIYVLFDYNNVEEFKEAGRRLTVNGIPVTKVLEIKSKPVFLVLGSPVYKQRNKTPPKKNSGPWGCWKRWSNLLKFRRPSRADFQGFLEKVVSSGHVSNGGLPIRITLAGTGDRWRRSAEIQRPGHQDLPGHLVITICRLPHMDALVRNFRI